MKMKQIEVTILGQNYLLGCPPGGDAALLDAVSMVDREMTAIREAGRVKARERIAVLAALNLAYALSGKAAEEASKTAQTAGAELTRTSADAAPTADAPEIEALVRRLDQALGDDGRLL